MGENHYTKGLYNKYDKNHKERDQLDYYATPPEEVLNILDKCSIDFTDCTILDPCAGQGHMMKGIRDYVLKYNIENCSIIGGDVQVREPLLFNYKTMGPEYDFLADNYCLLDCHNIDWIIMNPPFKTLEPFIIRALEIAKKGVITLARLQALEGQTRYEKVFSNYPPSDIYVYIERINCWKNGVRPTESSAQAYCWIIWNKSNSIPGESPHLRRIHRA